jgi:hypothetical protein
MQNVPKLTLKVADSPSSRLKKTGFAPGVNFQDTSLEV